MANEGSNRSYPSIGVPEGHHGISHHGGDPKAQGKIARINRHHVELFAKLRRAACLDAGGRRDASSTTARSSTGSCIGDGNRHNHDDLPLVLVGGGNGTYKTGLHARFPRGTPVSNLYLSLLDRMGAGRAVAPRPSFGDSTGRLEI